MATREWVAWFNQQRVLAPLRCVPPATCEAPYYDTLDLTRFDGHMVYAARAI
jgi:hypothetical protein